ncbi:hypothetical protein HPB52_008088 [Rhipicephalus sanguineus]|uniref:Uncharacterized protein n=1 Tax=Rhipicephalus sanguineus TaxID=34632 RepID=A0A9D4QIM8_RHISA|nr:hypothetical protein HPB52_008088 [Rhipicephalus sanguineus]
MASVSKILHRYENNDRILHRAQLDFLQVDRELALAELEVAPAAEVLADIEGRNVQVDAALLDYQHDDQPVDLGAWAAVHSLHGYLDFLAVLGEDLDVAVVYSYRPVSRRRSNWRSVRWVSPAVPEQGRRGKCGVSIAVSPESSARPSTACPCRRSFCRVCARRRLCETTPAANPQSGAMLPAQVPLTLSTLCLTMALLACSEVVHGDQSRSSQ